MQLLHETCDNPDSSALQLSHIRFFVALSFHGIMAARNYQRLDSILSGSRRSPEERQEATKHIKEPDVTEVLNIARNSLIGSSAVFAGLIAIPFAPNFNDLEDGSEIFYLAALVLQLSAVACFLCTSIVAVLCGGAKICAAGRYCWDELSVMGGMIKGILSIGGMGPPAGPWKGAERWAKWRWTGGLVGYERKLDDAAGDVGRERKKGLSWAKAWQRSLEWPRRHPLTGTALATSAGREAKDDSRRGTPTGSLLAVWSWSEAGWRLVSDATVFCAHSHIAFLLA